MLKLNFSRAVIRLLRQRAADWFCARHEFHKIHSASNEVAAETSKIGTRTISACKREAFTAAATAPSPRKSLTDELATNIAHAPSTMLPRKATLESTKDGEEDR